MKKYLFMVALAVVGLVVAFTAKADTTFAWSDPAQKGTLCYTNLDLASPLINGATLTASAASLNAAGNGVLSAATVTNLTVITGVTVPAASIDAAALSGNVAVARLTNALAGTGYSTNTLTGDGVTNVFIWLTVGGVKVLHSITTTP